MDLTNIEQFVIKLDNETSLKFNDFTQFERWLKLELRAWSWLDIENAKVGYWVSTSGNISPFALISELSDTLRAAENAGASSNNRLGDIVDEFRNKLKDNHYIASRTRLGEFVIEEGNMNPTFGLKLLEIVLNEDHNFIPQNRQELLAVFAFSDFRRGFSKTRLKKSIDKSEKVVTDLRHIQAEIVELKKSNQSDLDDFKKVMKEEIALKEPIDYWSQKATNHEKAKNRWGRVFTIYVSIVLFLLASFILGFEGGIQGFILSWKDLGIGAVASFAGLIGIGMVIARVLYRLFASQLHLWNDARERVTMIQTYLALAAQGHAKEEFLGALMQRLFSPSSDGIVKSDLGTIGPSDALMKMIGK